MFEDATTVILIRADVRTAYESWHAAIPNIEIGDLIRAYMPTGTTKCAEVLPRDDPSQGPALWKAVMRPC